MTESQKRYVHQCRYCANCIVTIQNTWWCERLDKDIDNPKKPNGCKMFSFTEIPADADQFGGTSYKPRPPRKPRPFQQMKLFDTKNNINYNNLIKDKGTEK